MSETRTEVHSQPQLKRYYADTISLAFIFHVAWMVGVAVAPFFLAYASGDFWIKSAVYYEQPTVQFTNRVVFVGYLSDSDYIAWSSVPSYNAFIDNSHLRVPVLKSFSSDKNFDGKADEITVTIKVPLKPDEEIKQAEILLFYNVQLMENLVLKLEGLVRVTASSPLPGAQLHVIGDLYFQQSDALSLQGLPG